MGDIAIHASRLGKQYYRSQKQLQRQTLRQSAMSAIWGPFRRAGKILRGQISIAREMEETFWALQDITFDVKHGEILGIIGRNGAGKSTLLKVLSRITGPTVGRAELYGRVGSLVEVGTGFHPEMSGRENVYMNGTILGMNRHEISRKFDEIVDFSGVEDFIDTPIKYYSSGMRVRLGFAVAAHLEPEILVVDEVLSVGDAAFRAKSLGKMGEVARQGRTVLFVSHNMATIQNLCERVMVLEDGQIDFDGETEDAIYHYMKSIETLAQNTPLAERGDRSGNQAFYFTDIDIRDQETGLSIVQSGNPVEITVKYKLNDMEAINNGNIALTFYDYLGSILFVCSTTFLSNSYQLGPAGEMKCHIPRFPLIPGTYRIKVWGAVGKETADVVEEAAQCQVQGGDYFNSGYLPSSKKHGHFLIDHSWSIPETVEKDAEKQ